MAVEATRQTHPSDEIWVSVGLSSKQNTNAYAYGQGRQVLQRFPRLRDAISESVNPKHGTSGAILTLTSPTSPPAMNEDRKERSDKRTLNWHNWRSPNPRTGRGATRLHIEQEDDRSTDDPQKKQRTLGRRRGAPTPHSYMQTTSITPKHSSKMKETRNFDLAKSKDCFSNKIV